VGDAAAMRARTRGLSFQEGEGGGSHTEDSTFSQRKKILGFGHNRRTREVRITVDNHETRGEDYLGGGRADLAVRVHIAKTQTRRRIFHCWEWSRGENKRGGPVRWEHGNTLKRGRGKIREPVKAYSRLVLYKH